MTRDDLEALARETHRARISFQVKHPHYMESIIEEEKEQVEKIRSFLDEEFVDG